MTTTQISPSDFFLRTRIKGWVTEVKHIQLNVGQGFFRTFIKVPALDKYEHASTFIVHGATPLGQEGQHVDIICRVRSVDIPEPYTVQLWADETANPSEDHQTVITFAPKKSTKKLTHALPDQTPAKAPDTYGSWMFQPAAGIPLLVQNSVLAPHK